MIKCEFDICIYNKNGHCELKNICISGAGCCQSCIIPTFPKEMLEKYKNDLIDKLNRLDKETT